MNYLQYDTATKLVISIHTAKVTPLAGCALAATDAFKPGDENDMTIHVGTVDYNGNLMSHSAVRNSERTVQALQGVAALKDQILKDNAATRMQMADAMLKLAKKDIEDTKARKQFAQLMLVMAKNGLSL